MYQEAILVGQVLEDKLAVEVGVKQQLYGRCCKGAWLHGYPFRYSS
jgi:hypothetical protein